MIRRALALCGCVALAASLAPRATGTVERPPFARTAESTTRRLAAPLRFEPNVGQAAPFVDAIARGPGYALALAGGDAFLALASTSAGPPRPLRVRLGGADPKAEISYLDPQPGLANYLAGSEPSTWRTGVRGYSKVRYAAVYPGVDLVFYGNPQELEYDFVVAAGADPSVIAFDFEGTDGLRLDENGDLVITIDGVEVRQKRPVLFQNTAGETRRTVHGEYVVDGDSVRFSIGDYDRTRPLVIDPVLLVYSTFLGGGGAEAGSAIASDPSGSAFVLGRTLSLAYPLVNPLQPAHAGGFVPAPIDTPPGVPPPPWYANNWDMVVSRFTPDGSALVYSTYIGGSLDDTGHVIAATPSGEAIVMGTTASFDFPSAPGYSYGCPCPTGFFLLKLNPSGTALTYVVRTSLAVSSVAADAAGNAYLAGTVNPAVHPDFPIVGAAQPAFAGNLDAFLLKLDASGTSVLYSTVLGGFGDDAADRVTVAPDGRIAIVGTTTSTDFPLVAPGQQTTPGVPAAFVTWFDPSGGMLRSYLLAGRFVLGSGTAAFGPDGSLYIAGHTADDGFPAINASQPARAGQHDVWIVKYSTAGDIVYSTYVGGAWPDLLGGIAGDAQGRVYILGRTLVGWTQGAVPFVFPYFGYPDQWDTTWDLTVVKLHASGAVANAVRIGGVASEAPAGLALDASGDVYLTGTTYSYDFPLVHALRSSLAPLFTFHGEPKRMDLFVTRMRMRMGPWPVTQALAPGQSQRVTIFGEEFHGDMRVFIGGQWATDVIVHDRHSMTVTVPALPPGLHDLVVIDSYGELVSAPNAVFAGACVFDVPAASQAFLSGGGIRDLAVTTTVPVCGWTAASDAGWVSVDPAGGAGSSSIRLTVQPNPTTAPRAATVTVGGRPVVVTQAASLPLDVNGDGLLDLIWRHEGDGRLAAWAMDGPTQVAGSSLSPAQVDDLEWTVAGTGDFDGDGQHDLVWQHTGNGALAVWLMQGLTLKQAAALTPSSVADLDWRVRTVGDLNGDGAPDLIWHHRTAGLAAVWLMDGLQAADARLLTAPVVADTAWQMVGAGDFTGSALFSPPDGRLDLVWQHEVDGRVAIWTMEGTTMTGGRDIQWFTPWRIEAVGDLTRDGALDFVVRDRTTGELRYIRYDPRVLTGSTIHAMTPAFVDPAWRIVAPR